MTIADEILDILDRVLYEDMGLQRFEALYFGGEEPLPGIN